MQIWNKKILLTSRRECATTVQFFFFFLIFDMLTGRTWNEGTHEEINEFEYIKFHVLIHKSRWENARAIIKKEKKKNDNDGVGISQLGSGSNLTVAPAK